MIRGKKIEDWFWYFAPRMVLTALIIGVLTRIALIINPVTVVGFSLAQWLKIFSLGMVNDLSFAMIALVPAFLVYTLLNKWKYRKAPKIAIFAILVLLTLYVILFNDITDEYGGVVPTIAKALLAVVTLLFALRLFLPSMRDGSRRVTIYTVSFLYAFLMVANVASEYTFWDEFGVRYNFIAVDYLVYTNEVIGNIMESYNMFLIVGLALACGALTCWLMNLGADLRNAGIASFKHWLAGLAAVSILAYAGASWLHFSYQNHINDNAFVTELQENGCWNFLEAFNSSTLAYDEFYAMIPEDQARDIQRKLCGQDENGVRKVVSEVEPIKKNVVLIMVESLSAEFFARYGSEDCITPNLDSISRQSLAFDRLFAAGNRSVRGLEAVTLCLPPSAGESIVKRPSCGGRFSTAEVFRSYGYKTRFIYGGDSYFDNMKAFFGAYGYDICDRSGYQPDEITFANIWGTCDEDSYKVALRLCDEDHEAGRPFFSHIMTISNHRPYTYPDGKIEYEGEPMSRKAAVKYTDFSIGRFIDEAKSHPWFDETIFVIVADHCASSAGKTSIPVGRYHIPAMFYSPGFIEPASVDKLCSQIDLMPTLFSLLAFSYDSRFYGMDILSPDFRERAFMATYQNLGYYADDVLTVLSPVRRVEQFKVAEDSDHSFTETPLESLDEDVLREAQGIYQTFSLE